MTVRTRSARYLTQIRLKSTVLVLQLVTAAVFTDQHTTKKEEKKFMGEDLMTIQAAAKHLGMTDPSVIALGKSGAFKIIKVGRKFLRVDRASLLAYLQKQVVTA
jgi:hypothetical protein